MNERIKELAEQSGFYVDSEPILNDSNNIRLQQFAELIVKECTDVLRDTFDCYFEAEQIEERFGVNDD